MLREFAVYRPLQVARFVKTLFRGKFLIAGVGVFCFDNGKVLLPDIHNSEMLTIFREVNQTISQLSSLPA